MGKEYILEIMFKNHPNETGRYNQGKPYALKKYHNAIKRVQQKGGGRVALMEYTYGPPPNYSFIGSKIIKRTNVR